MMVWSMVTLYNNAIKFVPDSIICYWQQLIEENHYLKHKKHATLIAQNAMFIKLGYDAIRKDNILTELSFHPISN